MTKQVSMDEAIGLLSTIRDNVETDIKKHGAVLAENTEKISKMSSVIADVQSKAQAEIATREQMAKKQVDMQNAVDAAEKKLSDLGVSLETIEKQSYRFSSGRPSVSEELIDKYNSALDLYIRKREPIPEALISDACKYLASYSIHSKSALEVEFQARRLAQESSPTNGYYSMPDLGRKEHSVGIGSEGGYFVKPDQANFSITREFETSPMRQVARIINAASDSVEIPIQDNESISGGWVAEKGARTETGTAGIGLATIYANEQFAEPKVTQKFLDDPSIDVVGFINQNTRDIITRTENAGFITGTGSDQPRGILSYPQAVAAGTYERGAISRFLTTNVGSIDSDSVISLSNSIKEVYQPRATWLMKRSTWTNIITLKDGQGRYLLNPQMLAEGARLTLIGKTVIFMDNMQSVATGNVPIAYGDFSVGYTIVDRFGFRVLRDEYTSKGFVKFYTTKRTGGAVTNYDSFNLLQVA